MAPPIDTPRSKSLSFADHTFVTSLFIILMHYLPISLASGAVLSEVKLLRTASFVGSAHGPLLPFTSTWGCCSAARHCRHSCILQHFCKLKRRCADKAAVQISGVAHLFFRNGYFTNWCASRNTTGLCMYLTRNAPTNFQI